MHQKISNMVSIGILTIIALLTLYPFILMIFTAFKTNPQFEHMLWLPTIPMHWENFSGVWREISPYIWNSIIVSGSTVVGMLILSSISAFVFARYNFPGKSFLFIAIISLLMIPGVLTLIPSFMLMVKLHLTNSLWGMIMPYIAGGQVMAIFILRSFFANIPEEIFESARIDGASEAKNFLHIALPLCKPMLGTIAVMNILATWNEYVWPLVIISTNDELRTLPLGLMAFAGTFYTNWGPLFAGYTLAALPLLIMFAFTMKYFIRGITSGAIKM